MSTLAIQDIPGKVKAALFHSPDSCKNPTPPGSSLLPQPPDAGKPTPSALAAPNKQSQLTLLAAMDRNALAQRWAEVFGCPAPRHSQAALLRAALAWHCQMAQIANAGPGGVERLIRVLRREAISKAPAVSLSPGTRLLREWQGQTHHVTVLAQGFEYNGKTYRSLTAITRLITGTPWSGPLFFGLRS